MNRGVKGGHGRRVAWTYVCLALLTTTTAFAAIAMGPADLGWAPLVQLAGDGDKQRAVDSLARYTKVVDALLRRLDMDQATEAFVEETIDSLEDFDLKDFYASLPEQRGSWRRLALEGELRSNRYHVGRPRGGDFEVSPTGKRTAPGDASAVLRAQKVKGADGDRPNYLMNGRAGVAIGKLGWGDMVRAGEELLRLGSNEQSGTQTPPSARALGSVKKHYRKLDAQEAVIVARLWDAFPASSALFAKLGVVEDVLASRDPSAGFTHVRGRMRLSPDKIDRHYSDLADYLEDLDELAEARIRWVDAKGRQLMALTVDTETMRMGFELFTKDGKLLPYAKGKVMVHEPVDPMGKSVEHTRFYIDATSKVMGMRIAIKRLRADFHYQPNEHSMRATGRARHMPRLKISGAAMGFIPTGLIDAFIPGNIEQIMNDFVRTAVKGNEGRGVAMATYLGQSAEGEPGVLDTNMGVEILDNFFVKMGMGIVADRVLPDDDTLDEMHALGLATHDAFTADLKRYASGS